MTAGTGPRSLVLGAPLSLSGRYELLGRLALAGLRQVVEDVGAMGGVTVAGRSLIPELRVIDDRSDRARVREALDALARCEVLVGPYGSDLTAEAARFVGERGRVLWNHGGSADEVQTMPGVVSVPSPARRYPGPVLEALAESMPGARVLVAAGRGRFSRDVAAGVREAAERLGMAVLDVVPHHAALHPRGADVLVSAGTFADDLELMARLRVRPPALAAVGAGIWLFGTVLGPKAEGVLGPSQWEERVRVRSDVGPRPAEVVRSLRARVLQVQRVGEAGAHVDYPAAQAYAAGLIALHCVERAGAAEDGAVAAVARELRCTTFFGRFGLGPDGRQEDHEMLAVQWQDGVKRVVWPPSQAEAGVRAA